MDSIFRMAMRLLLDIAEWNKMTEDWTTSDQIRNRYEYSLRFVMLYDTAHRSDALNEVEHLLAGCATLLQDRYGPTDIGRVIIDSVSNSFDLK